MESQSFVVVSSSYDLMVLRFVCVLYALNLENVHLKTVSSHSVKMTAACLLC